MNTGICVLLLLLISSFFADADTIDSQPGLHESNAVRLDSGEAENTSKTTPVLSSDSTRQLNYNLFGNFEGTNRRRCPLCDRTVFPYCGEKLFHDACCCTDPYLHPLPHKCHFADCAFLHANTCREHKLISNCCCSDEYRSLLARGIGKSDVAAVAVVQDKGKN